MRKRAVWESNPHYCAQVRTTAPYNSGRRLMDIMDMAVFDFLIGKLVWHRREWL